MRINFDAYTDWAVLKDLKTGLTTDVPPFDAMKARKILIEAEIYNESRLVRYAMRPFDLQWCYYSPIRPPWREPRVDYWFSYKPGHHSRLSSQPPERLPPAQLGRGLKELPGLAKLAFKAGQLVKQAVILLYCHFRLGHLCGPPNPDYS